MVGVSPECDVGTGGGGMGAQKQSAGVGLSGPLAEVLAKAPFASPVPRLASPASGDIHSVPGCFDQW